jgi:hypothetical protein
MRLEREWKETGRRKEKQR